jgi:hypothetical protein
MRITEPFIKISYVLWLLDKGAQNIRISVDGTEPEHQIIAQTLALKGFHREPLSGSKVDWTGKFSKKEVEIIIISKPGIDIEAHFPNEKVLLAECKGEPTSSATRSGQDLRALYTALGQLIITANSEEESVPLNLALVLPYSIRLKEILTRTARNTRLIKLGIGLAIIDKSGKVSEITPNLS